VYQEDGGRSGEHKPHSRKAALTPVISWSRGAVFHDRFEGIPQSRWEALPSNEWSLCTFSLRMRSPDRLCRYLLGAMAMGPLRNSRHEQFAQLIARGASATAAYVEAGYDAGSTNVAAVNGSRLLRTDKVASRVAELRVSQTGAARGHHPAVYADRQRRSLRPR
jgi:hypothetical protein